jgi:hypothetical protein
MISDLTEKTEPPPPLTQREMNQFITLAALPTLERALERLRWLEAEVVSLTAQRDEAQRDRANCTIDLVAARGCLSVVEEIAERSGEINKSLTDERDALAAEVAALKANDPLAEMWEALVEYQPQADKDGHGESWRRMCSERTGAAAFTAYAYAPSDADEAALAAARAIGADDTESRAARESLANLEAWNAIAAIRRAKEGR